MPKRPCNWLRSLPTDTWPSATLGAISIVATRRWRSIWRRSRSTAKTANCVCGWPRRALASFDSAEWVTAGEDFTATIGLAEYVPACRHAARLGRREAAAKEGRLRFALEEFNGLVAENHQDVLALIGRGMVQAELRRDERGVPDLNEAVACPQGVRIASSSGPTSRSNNSTFTGPSTIWTKPSSSIPKVPKPISCAASC